MLQKPHAVSRRYFLGGISTALLSTFVQRGWSVDSGVVIGHGEHRYIVDSDWGQRYLDPAKHPILNCHEMVCDAAGRFIMIGDHVANNVLIYSEEGQLLETWGTEYPGGHGLSITQNAKGEESLWIVDCGWYFKEGKWNRQQGRVVQTDLHGRVLLEIGHPSTYGAYEPGMNYMPTETAIGPDGSIYIADGYGSNYILRFDARGRYVSKFGGPRPADDVPESGLNNAHGIAVDLRDPARPSLIATSRSESCFKRYTLDGKYLSTIAVPGTFMCRPVISGESLFAGVCWSKENGTGKKLSESGFAIVLDQKDRVISAPGGTAPNYLEGVLQPLCQIAERPIRHGHDVCPDSKGNLIVCQWNAGKTYPVRLVKA